MTGKIKVSIRITPKAEAAILEIAKIENRNFSNMAETLLDEALLQRIIRQPKSKPSKSNEQEI